jgi:hypothetical protein
LAPEPRFKCLGRGSFGGGGTFSAAKSAQPFLDPFEPRAKKQTALGTIGFDKRAPPLFLTGLHATKYNSLELMDDWGKGSHNALYKRSSVQ